MHLNKFNDFLKNASGPRWMQKNNNNEIEVDIY
jgi:hypothetical protein